MDKWHDFKEFYNHLIREVYHEPDSFLTTDVVDKMLPGFLKLLPKDASILDLGCGAGYALTKMREFGYENVEGLTLDPQDIKIVEERGFKVNKLDFNFTGWENKWDAVWMRHVLEHSPFPFFTIYQLNKMMKIGGILYIEMPKPGTDRNLEHWPNHYSIMGREMYLSLFKRCGFEYGEGAEIDLELNLPEDKKAKETYDWYLFQKTKDIVIE